MVHIQAYQRVGGFMSELQEVSFEAKLAIIIRLAELIEEVKDAETLNGLRKIFTMFVNSLSFNELH